MKPFETAMLGIINLKKIISLSPAIWIGLFGQTTKITTSILLKLQANLTGNSWLQNVEDRDENLKIYLAFREIMRTLWRLSDLKRNKVWTSESALTLWYERFKFWTNYEFCFVFGLQLEVSAYLKQNYL